MMCDNCKERDAVITLTRTEGEGPTVTHLCEKCAAERGIETHTTAPKTANLLLAMQKQLPMIATHAGRCTFCSATLRDFRATGRLGCARCYTTFESDLRDLLRRVHGNSRHAGKRYEPPASLQEQGVTVLTELRERLRRAIESEQFELAAKLRDQIKVIE
jgi:protein arginine kinase activator